MGRPLCSFPESFVEPIPEFYDAVKLLAERAAEKFQSLTFPSGDRWETDRIVKYFTDMAEITNMLAAITRKELDKTALLLAERDFLKRMLSEVPNCVETFHGWYSRLFHTREKGMMQPDSDVADIHIIPTDDLSNPVGYIMHVGPGPINLAVVVWEMQEGRTVSFIGPVMSYYEHVSTHFKRLTDEEWETAYAMEPSFRPAFVNLYLAD